MKYTSTAAIPNQTPTTVTKPTPDLQEQIRLRAYGLYEQRGWVGHELDDWLQAESEVTQQKAKTVIAKNPILKERKRTGLNGVTGRIV
jgi:hypothetical protein